MTTSISNEHRTLIESCFEHRVPFFWRGSGTLLIASSGIQQVLEDAAAAGFDAIGLEGFEIGANARIHPRLDLIYDASRSPGGVDRSSILGLAQNDVWFDVTLHVRGSRPNAS